MFISLRKIQYAISKTQSINLGFTLIELLATFTLISIVSGLGFASFMSYSRRQVVVQAAADLKQIIDLARSNALSRVKPATCNMNEGLSNYKINFCLNSACQTSQVDYEMSATCAGLEEVQTTRKLPQNVTFSNVSGSPNCAALTFDVITKAVSGAPCEIFVNGYGNQIKVSADSNGHVNY